MAIFYGDNVLEQLYGADEMGASFARRMVRKTKNATKTVVRSAPVRQVTKAAAPVVRTVAKNPALRTAVSTLVPGGATALTAYDRLTAAQKVIVPAKKKKAPAQPAPSRAPASGRLASKVRSVKSAAQAQAQQAPESVFQRHKTAFMIGGGALLVGGVAAVMFSGKSKNK